MQPAAKKKVFNTIVPTADFRIGWVKRGNLFFHKPRKHLRLWSQWDLYLRLLFFRRFSKRKFDIWKWISSNNGNCARHIHWRTRKRRHNHDQRQQHHPRAQQVRVPTRRRRPSHRHLLPSSPPAQRCLSAPALTARRPSLQNKNDSAETAPRSTGPRGRFFRRPSLFLAAVVQPDPRAHIMNRPNLHPTFNPWNEARHDLRWVGVHSGDESEPPRPEEKTLWSEVSTIRSCPTLEGPARVLEGGKRIDRRWDDSPKGGLIRNHEKEP